MKIFKYILMTVFLLLGSLAFAEDKDASKEESGETPKEALQAIIKLYEGKNFEKLIKERYSEIHKADTPEKLKKFIEMFSKRYSNAKNLRIKLSFLKEGLKVEPEVFKNIDPNESEAEEMAHFPIKIHDREVEYILYKMKSGKWGFHF